MNDKPLGIGVVGFGGFGLFSVQHFVQTPEVKLVGMAATHREAAYAAAQRFGVPEPVEVDELVAWDNVDIVYIATPPFLHHEQAMAALEHGKHVICEKPLAVTMEQADELMQAAHENNLVLATNLMQRYNPLFDIVKRLIDSGVLGEMLHGYFENYATDEGLPPEHWFWDPERSGGIFVEHGVHFFDLFTGWLDDVGTVESAQTSTRSNSTRPGGGAIEDQVNCTVRYGDAVLVNFYHGFTQPSRMDRQELRLLFEKGDVTLYEWVPTVARIRAVVDEKGTRELMALFPGARLDILENYGGAGRSARGRHKALDIYQKIEIAYGESHNKMRRYGELLRGMIQDQVAYIRDRSHRRRVTEENGYNSLKVAVEAKRLAAGRR